MTKHPLGSGPVIERGTVAAPEACSSCCTRPPRPRGSRSRSRRPAVTPAPTPTRSTSRRGGIPTGLVAVPMRYMHSPVEMVEPRRHRRCRAADRGVRRRGSSRGCRSSGERRPCCCCCSTSTGRCCAAPPMRTATRSTRRCTRCTAIDAARARLDALAGGPHRRRDRARDPARRGDLGAADRRSRRRRARGVLPRSTRELCPPDLSEFVLPGVPELLAWLAGDADSGSRS